ncbi:hypothetical protein [Cellulomonas taurus]|uniref:hypothetical protein n=1 Tax=Cellulomonas taurus TaxID=2729175 RepID=UPI00145EF56F|nr:hypothetical protein [Cellulomonas taurus]
MSRFDISAVIRGHWKSLSFGEAGVGKDRLAHVVFLGVPGVLAALTLALRWELNQPAALLTAVALLISGALSVFAQMVGLRARLAERDGEWVERRREGLDETVNHLLAAVLVAIVDAIVLVVGMNVGGTGHVPWYIAWAAIFLTAYLGLLLLVCVPRLYSAYTTTFSVPPHLDGWHSSMR